ncbi:hypothetical protein [Streptosporangium sp. KLBMP 9127]|nr:hypothetical protein [Streptosporangium sp. KLBMP 9127]
MARMPNWMHSEPAVPVWPPDRYELRCTFPPPEYPSIDRYHFAEFAVEAARRLREIGLVHQLQVVRLSDGNVLFDLVSAHETPIDAW